MGLKLKELSIVQNLVQLVDDLVTEKEMFRQQLMRKEAELTRAEETIRREQQQMRQLVRVRGFPRDFPFPILHACACTCT